MHRESNSSEVDVVLKEALSLAEEAKKRDVSSELGDRVSKSMNSDAISLEQSDGKVDGLPKNATDTSPHPGYREKLKKVENTLDPAEQSAKYVLGVGELLGAMRHQEEVPK